MSLGVHHQSESARTADFKSDSLERIRSLHPKLVAPAMRVYNSCMKERIPMYVVWGKRSFEEQELLYRYGRTIPGDIQTLKRPGYSPHNYGLALDFCLIRYDEGNKQVSSWEECYDSKRRLEYWKRIVTLFEREGWEAGWRWPDGSFEPGHVENLMGRTILELYEEYESTKGWYNGYQNL